MIEAQLPDGTVLEFPDGTSQDVVQRVVRQRLGVQQQAAAPTEPQPRSFQGLRDLAGGAVRGAGSIGATILAPMDMLNSALSGRPIMEGNRQRRADIDAGLTSLIGSDPSSATYQGGKLAGELAGSMGAGGAVASAGARVLPKALAQALRTGGAGAGPIGTRIAGAAGAGAASAGLVDPGEAMQGAGIGAALPVAGKVLGAAGSGVRHVVGLNTGVGSEALSQAAKAGAAGGGSAESFIKHLRGKGDIAEPLAQMRANVQAMGARRSADYLRNMESTRQASQPLLLDDVSKALRDGMDSVRHGTFTTDPAAVNALGSVREVVEEFRTLPRDQQTAIGFDALKRRISAIEESLPFEAKNARRVVGDVRNATKQTIVNQSPEYAKAMREYEAASDTLEEITRALSLNDRAAADTGLRKLQSLMRNNVNTNYGFRQQLAEQAVAAGGQNPMPALAGQALSEWTPRGLARFSSGGLGAGLAATGNIPQAVALGALSSPRLMGESAYYLGKAGANPMVQALRRGAYLGAPSAIANNNQEP